MTARAAVRWAFGVGILVVVAVTLDAQATVALLRNANGALVLAGVAGLSALHLLGAAAWRDLVRQMLGRTLEWWPAIRHYYASQALGGLTPANLGGDAYRVLAIRETEALRRAAQPVVVQRATSSIAVVAVAAAALVAASRPDGDGPALAVGILLLPVIGLQFASWLPAMRHRVLFPNAVRIGLSYGITFHVLGIGLTYLLVLAVDSSAGSLASLAAVAVSRMALLVPLTPSGLGIQEALLAVLFVGIGLPADVALAASLLARVSLILTSILGAAAVVSRPPAASRVTAK